MAEKRIPHVNYYEGILQLRDFNDEVVQFIENEFSKEDPTFIRITKIEKVKNGLDIYITSKKYMQKLAKKLYSVFGGEVKASPQLFSKSHQTSKEIFRLNIYYRPSQFKRDDIITDGKNVYKVSSSTKKISGFNLETGKKVTLDYSDKIKKLEPVQKTMVSKIKPHIEVLDPETYQPIIVRNKKDVKMGQNVKVVIYNQEAWLI